MASKPSLHSSNSLPRRLPIRTRIPRCLYIISISPSADRVLRSHALIVLSQEKASRMISWYWRSIKAGKANAYLVIYMSCHSPAQQPTITPYYLTHVQTKPKPCLYLALGDLSVLGSACSSKRFLVLTSLHSSHIALLSVSREPSKFLP